ncbi:MAG: methyltransferase [Alphaproteobacteria bacterium]|nr:methyltransferase [Alphaproteobacteria bacterium]
MNEKKIKNEITEDFLLGKRVILKQSSDGYRAAIDPVFLAAATPAKDGDKVLDVGSGTGAASLCLAKRVNGLKIDGVELQDAMLEKAIENAKLNGVDARFVKGDVVVGSDCLEKNSYDCVMTNPPFMDGGMASPNRVKSKAHAESSASLADWITYCVKMVKPRGTFSIIHRADRVDEILYLISGKLGGITVIPLWPKVRKNAKRVIVVGRKGVKTPAVLSCGIVVHNDDGSYTTKAEDILRNALPVEG